MVPETDRQIEMGPKLRHKVCRQEKEPQEPMFWADCLAAPAPI